MDGMTEASNEPLTVVELKASINRINIIKNNLDDPVEKFLASQVIPPLEAMVRDLSALASNPDIKNLI